MTSPGARQPRPTTPPRPPAPPPPPPDVYPTARAFFEDALSAWYARSPHGLHNWCPEWELHPEAFKRVADLHMAWEDANRAKGTHRADWWVRWADPIMRELMSGEGTFAGCTWEAHASDGVEALPG